MALTGFLQLPEPKSVTVASSSWSRERFDLIMNQHDIEEALSTVFISAKDYRAQRAARLARVNISWRGHRNETPADS
jgi:hypothetical protein